MKAFLDQLADRMAAVDLGKVPDSGGRVERGEKVVGVLGADLQRMYALRIEIRLDHMRAVNEAHEHALIHLRQKEGGHDTAACDQIMQRLALAELWHDTVDKIFWVSVHTAFPETLNKAAIGIRKKWQVVYTEDNDPAASPLGDLLEALFRRKQ